MKVHFIGIGGIGVSALAKHYLKKNHKVSGSDLSSSEITESLKKMGAEIYIGKHESSNFKSGDLPDLVIFSPAVRPDNPELKFLNSSGVDCQSYPQALGELTKKYCTIAISGTHGKSTTTGMIALLLVKAGLDPTVIIGTKLKELSDSASSSDHAEGLVLSHAEGSNCRVGNSKYLVIEADEHMASFLNYWPKIMVLTTLEEDHLDYYKNLKNILKTFKEYIGHLPEDGYLAANGDDKNIRKITNRKLKIKDKKYYSLKQKEAKKLSKIMKIPGKHNVSDALAALTVARILKIPDKISFKSLSEYTGSWRRFEIKPATVGNKKITLVSDYGHHPTEVKVTLASAREKWPDKNIWCVFQPHQYQRTYYLFKDFIKVFKGAPVDRLIITDIYEVAGREKKEIRKKVDSQKLVRFINKGEKNRKAEYLSGPGDIMDYLNKNLSGNEVVIIMGAGDIYNLTKEVIK